MAVSEAYRRQVMLLVRTIPFVATETCFALKAARRSIFFFAICRGSPWTSISPTCRWRIGQALL